MRFGDLLKKTTRAALQLPDESLSWNDLLRSPKGAIEKDLRVAFCERNSLALVQNLIAHFEAGAVPVLAHPRWPTQMRIAAFEKAGVGRKIIDVKTVLFSSGSTAAPKAIAHTFEAHVASARASQERTPFCQGHVWLLSLPLCHVGGLSLLFRAAVGGGALALMKEGESLAQALRRTRPTHLSVVATQLSRLCEAPDARALFASLKYVLVGGGPCAQNLLERARRLGAPVRQTYGCTEGASQLTTQEAAQGFDSGRALEGVHIRLDNNEIVVASDSLMSGLLEQDELVDPCQMHEGKRWFRTKDLGSLDDKGRLSVWGRKDNQFISGGENIQPEALEALFAQAGHDVVIVDVLDDKWGKVPVAFSRDGVEVAAELPSYARPVAFYKLPESAGLKVQRARLREIAETLRKV